MSGCSRPAAALLATFLLQLPSGRTAACLPLVPDAASLARGGETALAGVERSPGSPRPAGWSFRIDGFEPYVGTGLVGAAVALEKSGARAGAGFGFATLWSPVGVVRAFDAGLQLGRGPVTAGAGVHVRGDDFVGYPVLWDAQPRAGIGWRRGEVLRCAAVVERAAGPLPHPRLCAALAARAVHGIELAVQLEREPGVESRTSFGLAAGEAPFRFLAGFDVASQSCSFGFAWSGERQGIAWGARTHPVLGWSHAWSYERGH